MARLGVKVSMVSRLILNRYFDSISLYLNWTHNRLETDRIDIQTSLTECSQHRENISLASIRLLNVKIPSPINPTHTCEIHFLQ